MVRLLPMTTYSLLAIAMCSSFVVHAQLHCESDEDCTLYFVGGICVARGDSEVGICVMRSAIDSRYRQGIRKNDNTRPTACYLCDTLPFCGINPYCKIVGCC
ncbi:hypothetical protein DdX_10972 [Ditylenchus destructor]|uniref:Uncharacterized protein n=1 Tax=Ditylenchus destructor TaxID=166010 RepID=A0AAD4R516_9BILA|nr:hypothetical protein DdX_10972 [Ditylenchus destructor]